MNDLALPVRWRTGIIRALQRIVLRLAVLLAFGDTPAFALCEGAVALRAENALKSYGDSLLRLAFSYVHSVQDAEDILQDSLIQYMRKAPVFANEAHEKAWLMTVVSNACKNRLRHMKRLKEEELTEFVPDEREAEDLSFVWQCVKELPGKYSEVLHLYYYEGYSTAEIGAILSKNEATVRSLLMRGRNLLKTPLEDVYGYEE